MFKNLKLCITPGNTKQKQLAEREDNCKIKYINIFKNLCTANNNLLLRHSLTFSLYCFFFPIFHFSLLCLFSSLNYPYSPTPTSHLLISLRPLSLSSTNVTSDHPESWDSSVKKPKHVCPIYEVSSVQILALKKFNSHRSYSTSGHLEEGSYVQFPHNIQI